MIELRSSTNRPAPATGPTTRDAAATALVLGFAGAVWGAWGQANPPAGWSLPLTIGSVLGLLLALVAGIRTVQRRTGDSAMWDRRGRRTYYRTVGVEVALILLGVLGLGIAGHPDYLAAWILLVVGVHFIPLGRLFRDTVLIVAGALLSGVAGAAVVVGVTGHAAPSAVAGAGGLLVMLVAGVLALRQSMRTVG